jgi:hypothetical protein
MTSHFQSSVTSRPAKATRDEGPTVHGARAAGRLFIGTLGAFFLLDIHCWLMHWAVWYRV